MVMDNGLIRDLAHASGDASIILPRMKAMKLARSGTGARLSESDQSVEEGLPSCSAQRTNRQADIRCKPRSARCTAVGPTYFLAAMLFSFSDVAGAVTWERTSRKPLGDADATGVSTSRACTSNRP
jgi:hypothetical protein